MASGRWNIQPQASWIVSCVSGSYKLCHFWSRKFLRIRETLMLENDRHREIYYAMDVSIEKLICENLIKFWCNIFLLYLSKFGGVIHPDSKNINYESGNLSPWKFKFNNQFIINNRPISKLAIKLVSKLATAACINEIIPLQFPPLFSPVHNSGTQPEVIYTKWLIGIILLRKQLRVHFLFRADDYNRFIEVSMLLAVR